MPVILVRRGLTQATIDSAPYGAGVVANIVVGSGGGALTGQFPPLAPTARVDDVVARTQRTNYVSIHGVERQCIVDSFFAKKNAMPFGTGGMCRGLVIRANRISKKWTWRMGVWLLSMPWSTGRLSQLLLRVLSVCERSGTIRHLQSLALCQCDRRCCSSCEMLCASGHLLRKRLSKSASWSGRIRGADTASSVTEVGKAASESCRATAWATGQ